MENVFKKWWAGYRTGNEVVEATVRMPRFVSERVRYFSANKRDGILAYFTAVVASWLGVGMVVGVLAGKTAFGSLIFILGLAIVIGEFLYIAYHDRKMEH